MTSLSTCDSISLINLMSISVSWTFASETPQVFPVFSHLQVTTLSLYILCGTLELYICSYKIWICFVHSLVLHILRLVNAVCSINTLFLSGVQQYFNIWRGSKFIYPRESADINLGVPLYCCYKRNSHEHLAISSEEWQRHLHVFFLNI